MILRFTSILLIAGALCLGAQTKSNKVTILDGPENDTKRSSVLGMFGYDQSGYYTLRYEKKKLLVEHLSPSMAVDNSVEVEELKEGKTELAFHSAHQLGDNLYFFYTSAEDKKKERERVLVTL